VRDLCLALPGTSERLSHGAPTFFVGPERPFARYVDDHEQGRAALCCAAPPGMQHLLVASAPQHYFVPDEPSHRGWIGLRLDRTLHPDDIAGAVEDAFLTIAPEELIEAEGLAAPSRVLVG
jgi:hypothetical protein